MQWIVRYILFHNKRHPKDMGVPEIEEFLTHLAVEGNVVAATQNQSFSTQFYFCTAKFCSSDYTYQNLPLSPQTAKSPPDLKSCCIGLFHLLPPGCQDPGPIFIANSPLSPWI